MHRITARPTAALALLAAALLAAPARAEDETPPPEPDEIVEVTATRVPEPPESVPVAITVIDGDDLRARGATDLASALAAVAGVSVAPGGDGGPAASVPELWGLREFDAFLLVVDGVPWGGAFNPALASVDLAGIDRIEVLRGPAPVLFGATSFVGVIQVLHRRPGSEGRSIALSAGSWGAGGVTFSGSLPEAGRWRHLLIADGTRARFRDDRTAYDRAHALYRAEIAAAGGTFRLDLDATRLAQNPASPHPRAGTALSPLVPLDANANPSDAKLDQDRLHAVGGYDRAVGGGTWSTTLALTRTSHDIVRGFLTELADVDPNATGYRQDRTVTDVYLDSHVALTRSRFAIVAGVDHLHGKADAESEIFDYAVPLGGSSAPASGTVPAIAATSIDVRRDFTGLYLQAEWRPSSALRVDLGLRLNRTDERREVGDSAEGPDRRTTTRPGGTLGASFLARRRESSPVWLFADYRDTFKPAAVDFGPDAERDILEPETARAWEAGVKGRVGRTMSWQASAFRMDFENLVVSQESDRGLPALVNAGSQRFEGFELEADTRLRSDLRWRIGYARHDARFRDYERLFDGVPTQLRGNRLEMSARDLASTALVWAPPRGFGASVSVDWVGRRFLDKRNRASAPAYVAWSAGLAWRGVRHELRLEGRNLGDNRPPVAESELGDAQYYRLPARSFRVVWGVRL